MLRVKTRRVATGIGAIFAVSCFCGAAHAEISATDAAQHVGITPQTVVVADLADQSEAILGAIQEAADLRSLLGQQMNEADAIQSQIAQEMASLELTGESNSAALQNLQDSLQQTVEDVQATKQSIYNVATQVLSDSDEQALANVIEVGFCRVPSAFRVLDKTADEWAQAERALRYERRAEQLDEPLDSQWANLLEQIRSDSAVIAAGSRLEVQLPGAEATFQNYD